MGGLIRPADELQVVRINLRSVHKSDYLRRLEEEGNAPLIVSPLAELYMSMELSGKSDYLENKDLDHNLGKTSFTMISTLGLALCTVVPTDSSTGATITEASYTGYARKKIEAATLNAAASGSTASNAAYEFANCTAGSATVIGWAALDGTTIGAGNIHYWGTATSTVISTTQTPPTISSGGFVVNED